MRSIFLVLGVLLLGHAGFLIGWAVGTNNERAANEKAAQGPSNTPRQVRVEAVGALMKA
jgi:hypothetical protein